MIVGAPAGIALSGALSGEHTRLLVDICAEISILRELLPLVPVRPTQDKAQCILRVSLSILGTQDVEFKADDVTVWQTFAVVDVGTKVMGY